MACFHDAPAAVYAADYMRCLDSRSLVGLGAGNMALNFWPNRALFSIRSDDRAKKPSRKREQCALTLFRRQVRTKSKMESRTCLRESQCLIGNCLTGLSKNAYHSCALKVACHCHTRGQYASHNQDKKHCQHAQRRHQSKHNYSTRLWSRCGKDMDEHNLNKTWSALTRQ